MSIMGDLLGLYGSRSGGLFEQLGERGEFDMVESRRGVWCWWQYWSDFGGGTTVIFKCCCCFVSAGYNFVIGTMLLVWWW